MTTRHLLMLLVCVSLAVRAAAQAATPAPTQAAAPTQPPAPAANLPAPPSDFAYNGDGRRDPFMNLSRRTAPGAVPAGIARPSGAAGLLVDEVAVRGVVLSQGAYVAMVSGPSGQTFTVRVGSKLYDGTVKAISPRAVVMTQLVNDPLTKERQREVLKPLRIQEEGK